MVAQGEAIADVATTSPCVLRPRSLAGKPLAWFRATPTRRIAVLYDMLVYVIRCTNALLYR